MRNKISSLGSAAVEKVESVTASVLESVEIGATKIAETLKDALY